MTMETIEIQIKEKENDIGFTIVRHSKHSSAREKVFCDGWVKLVESIILTSQMVANIKKIALKDAIVAWTPTEYSKDGIGKIKVFNKREHLIPEEYICSDGACYSDWQEAKCSEQLEFIQKLGNKLMNEYNFTAEQVDDAFVCITEYLEAKSND